LARWTPPQTLNAIVDADVAARSGWLVPDLARAFLRGGARFLQLRAKTISGRDFLRVAESIVGSAHEVGAIVLVNDRADIARLSGADGVHVGHTDLSPSEVRKIVGDAAVVGLSTHTAEEVAAALREPISYLAIGPVFGTATKAAADEPVGIAGVEAAARMAGEGGVPVVAIGGITLERTAEILGAGAAAAAVIGDLVAGGDPEQRVRQYLRR
jgi:thiamine-phosphate diphosphorylase